MTEVGRASRYARKKRSSCAEATCFLPACGRSTIILTTACPSTGSAWTSTGTPFEPRGLKHPPGGTIRVVPIPPVLVRILREHLHAFGTAPDGRLFRGAPRRHAQRVGLRSRLARRRARPARKTEHGHPRILVFPQPRRHLSQYKRRPGDARIRPTHSPRNRADGFPNLSFCTEKPVTQSRVTGSDLGFYVVGVGFEPT